MNKFYEFDSDEPSGDFNGDMYDSSEAIDIRKFCRSLEEAWKLTPRMPLFQLLGVIFDGYDPTELTSDEMNDMINEYILQNE